MVCLYNFHVESGTVMNKIPSVDKRPVDLYNLFECVTFRGGFKAVCDDKLWAQIGRELGYAGRIMTSLSTSLKALYNRVLLPFEKFVFDHWSKNPARSFPLPSRSVVSDEPFLTYFNAIHAMPGEVYDRNMLKRTADMSEEGSDQGPSEHIDKKIKLSDSDQKPILSRVSCSSIPLTRAKEDTAKSSAAKLKEGISESDLPWHYGIPEMSSSPYVYKESPTYNLRQLQNKALNSQKLILSTLGKQESENESDAEKGYWELLSDQDKFASIEYAMDIPSSVHGSGFPLVELSSHDPLAKDPWNPNVLPFCNKSFFRYVDADVPYLVKPSLQVGLFYSTQSWNFADFFTGKVIYHHFGATKTWYSIPEQDFEKFQALLQKEIGTDESNPGVVLEPNAMVSPEVLRANGISCYAADQRPGQLILTFPKAHTSHFNHGFSLSESVNVAMFPDWLSYGQECAALYAKCKIQPPFSLNRLVLSMAKENVTSSYISAYVVAMCKKELEQRNLIRSKFKLVESLAPTENCVCSVTHAFSYLSHVRSHTGVIMSLEAFLQNPSPFGDLILELSDQDLATFERAVSRQSQAPSQWTTKFQTFMAETARPSLQQLESLLQEGERLGGHPETVANLRQFVTDAHKWVSKARKFLSGDYKYDPETLQELLDQSESASFTSPELTSILDKAREIHKYCNKAERILSGPTQPIEEYQELLKQGIALNVLLPVTEVLSAMVERLTWMEGENEEHILDLDETLKKIDQGVKLDVPEDHPFMKRLCIQKDLGVQLEIRVRKALSDEKIQFSDLQSIMSQAKQTPISSASMQRLIVAHDAHLKALDQLQSLAKDCNEANREKRPTYSAIMAVIAEASKLNSHPQVPELEHNIQLVNDWLRHGKRLFGKGNAALHIVGLQLANVSSRNSACFIMEKSESQRKQLYCFCHTTDVKSLMVECSVCHEHYHRKCLRMPRGKLGPKRFVCQVCDWRVELPRESFRPTLEALKSWLVSGEQLPIQPDELELLRAVVFRATVFYDQLTRIVNADDKTSIQPARLTLLQSLLRKLEGADIVVSTEHIDYLRMQIHLLQPTVAPPPPKFDEVERIRRESTAPSSPSNEPATTNSPSDISDTSRAATPSRKSSNFLDRASSASPYVTFSVNKQPPWQGPSQSAISQRKVSFPTPSKAESFSDDTSLTPPIKVRRKPGPKPGSKRRSTLIKMGLLPEPNSSTASADLDSDMSAVGNENAQPTEPSTVVGEQTASKGSNISS